MGDKGDKFWLGLLIGGVAGGVGYAAYQASKDAKKPILDQMKDNVRADQKEHSVVDLADSIVVGTDPSNGLVRLTRVYQWVTTNLKWLPDPARHDRAQTFARTLERAGGDCDCLTTAFCTLAEAAGHPTWLLTFPRDNPDHVLATVPVAEKLVQNAYGIGRFYEVLDKVPSGPFFWYPLDPSLQPGMPGALGPRDEALMSQGNCLIHAIS